MSGMLASTAAAVGIIDRAVCIAKKLADDDGELDKATLKLELAHLMTELASAKMEVVTTQMLLFDAEQQNKNLEEKLKDKHSYTFKDGLYWKEGDKTAYCPKCYEVEKVQTHMVYARAVGKYSASWYCNNCRTCIYPNAA